MNVCVHSVQETYTECNNKQQTTTTTCLYTYRHFFFLVQTFFFFLYIYIYICKQLQRHVCTYTDIFSKECAQRMRIRTHTRTDALVCYSLLCKCLAQNVYRHFLERMRTENEDMHKHNATLENNAQTIN